MDEILEKVKILKPEKLMTYGLHDFVRNKFRESASLSNSISFGSSQICKTAFIWRSNDINAGIIEQKVRATLLEIELDVSSQTPSVDPLRMIIAKAPCAS